MSRVRSMLLFSLVGATLSTGSAVNVVDVAQAGPSRPQVATAIQPQRVLDTRSGFGAARPEMIAPGRELAVAVPAASTAAASSVVLNLTATDATSDGWVKAWPCGEPVPATSSLNFAANRTVANAVMLKLPPGGVCLATSAPVNLVADVTGWYTGTEDFNGSTPSRVLDTRSTGDPLRAGLERRLKIAGTPGIAANATIAALNLTVDRPSAAGWVVAYPCGQPTNSSTVNFQAGEIVANLTVVGLGGGDVCFRSLGDVQLVVDTYGWSTGAGKLKVASPTRLLDTRDAQGISGQVLSASTIDLPVAGNGGVPTDADAALLTVTVTNSSSDGFVTVWPCDQPFPVASTINTWPSALRSNLAFVKLSALQGTACLQYRASKSTPIDFVVDVVGWTTGGPARNASTLVGCGLAAAAFCETFNAPAGQGTRTGDLDPVLWGVSRLGDISPGTILNNVEDTQLVGCASTATVSPPHDVIICNGQMREALNDNHVAASLHTYPKQPFNFAGRTGKVVFDVSGDSGGTHAAWPEFFITDKPVPGMRGSISGLVPPGAANSIGFALAGCAGSTGNTTGVSAFFMTKNNVYSEPAITSTGCITKGSALAMNHIEVRVSTARIEVWGTDAGSSALKQLAVANNLGLAFTQGLVWLNDVHYNARKAIEPCACGTQFEHTFVWDNLGFDGPKTYRDLGFDVPDANIDQGSSTRGGYLVGNGPITLTVAGVNRVQAPTAAQVVLNTYSFAAVVPSISVNGGPWIDTPWPYDGQTYSFRTLSIPVPLEQVHDGTNTISFRSGDGSTTIANVSIILVAAAPVP